jgi:hypothetical protein
MANMKRILLVTIFLSLLSLSAVSAWATDAADTTTITVDYVDLLSVPASAALTLTATTPGATTYTEATLTQANGLMYSHNSTNAKKITATAVPDSGNPSNDITLQVAIAGGQPSAAVVSSGTAQSGVLLWDSISANGYTKDITWTVDGSLAGTNAGADANQNYVWTVTFTSADH